MAEKQQKQKKARDTSAGGAPSFVPGEEPLENEQHERFCQELLMMKPQVRAYQIAYPEASYQSAAANATRLLKDAKTQDRLEYLRTEQRNRLKMGADEIHQRLVMAANIDFSEFVSGTGHLLVALSDLPPEVRLCIESIETKKDGTIKVTTVSKTKALEMLGRHRKMFRDQLDVNVTHSLEEIVGGTDE